MIHLSSFPLSVHGVKGLWVGTLECVHGVKGLGTGVRVGTGIYSAYEEHTYRTMSHLSVM